MLSRMAESLYWIGRYVERAEQTARLTAATFGHTLAMGSTAEAEARRDRHWAALLDIVGEQPAFPPGGLSPDEESVPAHLIFSTENANSIVECIARARDNARTMRHQVATEMWEALNRFYLEVQRPGQRRRAASGAENGTRFCRSIVEFSQLLQGITDSTMPREEGWYFLQAGKFLERAEWTARTLDVNYRLLVGDGADNGDRVALAAAADDLQPWGTLLRSLSAYESYHRIESRGIQPSAVIELLILSPVLAALDPLLDRAGRRRPRPHHRAGAGLQRLRADAGREHRERGAPRGRPAARRVRLPAARRPARSGPARVSARHAAPLLPHRRPRSRTSSSPTAR